MILNKIVIPAILVATVLITGFFAFMPIDEAITVHTTLQSQIGETFRVSTGSQTLGAVGGTSTFVLNCTNACIVESIHGWTTGDTDDGDVVFVVNIKGTIDVLEKDITSPSDNALGDISVGAAPSNIVDLLKMIQSQHNVTGSDQATVESISVVAGGTVEVRMINSVDVSTVDASFVIVFTGKNLGTTLPTASFTAES